MVSHNTSSSSASQDIMMMFSQQVMVATRSKDYGCKGHVVNGNETTSSGQPYSSIPPPPSEPLQIEKSNLDMMIRPPPKGVLWKLAFNPHARVA